MIGQNVIARHLVRFLFVIFWAVIIYLFLLLPYTERLFFHDQEYLCIYTWADRVDETVLQNFEKETGIKVYMNYYESNEELLTKLENMPFVDCDIILPSGYIISSMIQSGLLKKMDRAKCHFLDRMYPDFLHSHDSKRDEYTVPLYWDVLGIGYNNQKVKIDDVSLKAVFDQKYLVGHQIGMIDDSRQSIFLAALYLGYSLDSLSKAQLKDLRKLLNEQKQWVGAYSDSQQGYFLASKTFAIVASEREHICKQMLNHDFVSFYLPKEGSLITADHVVISASTKKDELVYKFINYLFEHDVLKYNCEAFCLMPTVKDVFEKLDQKYIGVDDLWPGSEKFKELKVFKNILTHKQINDFWVRLKSV